MDKRLKPVLIGCGILFGLGITLIFGGIVGLGVAIQAGWMADTEAMPGERLPRIQVDEISEIVGLRSDEEILYFYGAEFFVADDGNLITNQRVISYERIEGQLDIYSAEYVEISDAKLTRATGWLEDSTIDVYLKENDEGFPLWVSSENDGDEKFHRMLLENLRKYQRKRRAEGPDASDS